MCFTCIVEYGRILPLKRRLRNTNMIAIEMPSSGLTRTEISIPIPWLVSLPIKRMMNQPNHGNEFEGCLKGEEEMRNKKVSANAVSAAMIVENKTVPQK